MNEQTLTSASGNRGHNQTMPRPRLLSRWTVAPTLGTGSARADRAIRAAAMLSLGSAVVMLLWWL